MPVRARGRKRPSTGPHAAELVFYFRGCARYEQERDVEVEAERELQAHYTAVGLQFSEARPDGRWCVGA